jgi:hypothetical protein
VSLLFDENLSPRRIRRLEGAYPQSEHVELVGLKGQPEASLVVLDLPRQERG